MKSETIQKLLKLNYQFYQTFAAEFSATRQRLQPGVRNILLSLPKHHRILDVGCGNGNIWRFLTAQGHHGPYVGLDFSPDMLRHAIQDSNRSVGSEAQLPPPIFVEVNLSQPGWSTMVPAGLFDSIFFFAVLHHLPGLELRLSVLRQLSQFIGVEGRLAISVWQFMKSSRLQKRIHDWIEIGVLETEIDPGDYLIDWRRGGSGLRYVHEFDHSELAYLAHESGFRIISTAYSDGVSRNLSCYQIWQKG